MQDAVLGWANISVYDAPEERVVVVSHALPKLYTLSRASWEILPTGTRRLAPSVCPQKSYVIQRCASLRCARTVSYWDTARRNIFIS